MSVDLLNLIGRSEYLFTSDIERSADDLKETIKRSKFLVIGGAGTIGQATAKEIFKHDPAVLHVVDISENNMVELVRDIRSSQGYGTGDFRTFAIDVGSTEFKAFYACEGPYDYVFNLSALKHVRSEKDPFTLMRMVMVNIFNTLDSVQLAKTGNTRKYFCVSTDKAANPVNMMGASKRIMEMFLLRESLQQQISMARFANVAFSDGSLLHGFNQRLEKKQPIAAPKDVKRYFVTPEESGQLCLLSGIFGNNRDIFFPKLNENLHLITFSEIATKYLERRGLEAVNCESEEEARRKVSYYAKQGRWPCYFFNSDTTGEKDFEEFYTSAEKLEMQRFQNIGVIRNDPIYDEEKLNLFSKGITSLVEKGVWDKHNILRLFLNVLPDFNHLETGRYLDQKM